MQTSRMCAALLALALAVPAAAADEPGVFKIPGTETTLKLNGYVEVDMAYDFDGADENIRGNDWASFIPLQPLDENVDQVEQPNRFYMTARTSRIGLTTTTPTKGGPLVVRLEGDFNNPSPYNYSTEITTNGTGFRIRHAYGEYRGLLVGQTWSNFMDLDSMPETVEFNNHGAFASIRTPMIRYAAKLGGATLSVSLENPQSLVINASVADPDNDSLTVGRRYDRVPAVTASYTIPFSLGHLNLRGVTHEYQGQLTEDPNPVTDSAWGWGVGASGSLKFKKELFTWSVQGGDGIGFYMFQSLLQGAGFVGNELELWRSWAYHVGLTHTFSPAVRGSVVWTQTFFDKNDALAATLGSIANERIDVGYVNLFHSPVKGFEYGFEYAYGVRQIFDSVAVAGNDTGTQHRLNALFRYGFF